MIIVKKFISLVLALMIAFGSFAVSSSAATYKATWTLDAQVGSTSYNSDDTITVAPGQTVYVTLSLSNNYYTGPTCAQIFYTSSVFTGISTATFNKNGRLYEVCGSSYCTCYDWDRMADKTLGWPKYDATKLAEFKDTHHFLRFTMTPNSGLASAPIKSVDEQLVTIPFNVSASAQDGTTGEIIIPHETMRTADNKSGFLYCGVYASGDFTSEYKTYVSGQVFDCSKAVLKFKVSDNAITLNSDNLTLNYKSSAKLDATVNAGKVKTVNWTSSNSNVATVDDNGNVKATGKGTATITATTTDGKYSADCTVKVKYSFIQIIIIYCLFGFIWYK